ncbi:MAG: hypothetical protein ACLT2F_02545 [Butyricicoccus sp.]
MQKAEKMQELRVFAQEIRVETLKTVGSLGFGHVPGAMSVIDALAVLYGEVMKVDPKNPHWEDRDWCVLSKGHAGPAMYATLGLKGFYPVGTLIPSISRTPTSVPFRPYKTPVLT